MLKKLPLKAKIVGGITLAAALGAIAVLIIILLNGKTDLKNGGDTDLDGMDSSQVGDSGMDSIDMTYLIAVLPDEEALGGIHTQLIGFWVSDNRFVGFTYADDALAIEYGLFQTGFGVQGKIIDARAVSVTEAQFTILIPAVPASEMNEARPERTATVTIDISNFRNNRLNVKIVELESGEWLTYGFGGSTLEEAYDN